ncbi:MAG TPA: hypothetical protein VLC95_02230 [Anaerolineae bacterium]|nr:hypothetical protein [Anaerolineae bacterium]
MKRAILALLLLATAAGAAGGVYYSWVVDPVAYVDTPPDTLRAADRLVYLALVGDLYAHDGDLDLARERLALLGLPADGQALGQGLAAEIEAYLDAGGRPEDVRNLAHLAQVLGASGGVLLVFASGPVASTTATLQPEPPAGTTATAAASPTPHPTFLLVEQTALCAEPGTPGQIGVWVQDAAGEPLPGVQVVVNWAGGQDRFFTGLHPDMGPGYGDFDMAPRTEYEVSLGGLRSDVAHGLASAVASGLCREGVKAVNWRLTFQQGDQD